MIRKIILFILLTMIVLPFESMAIPEIIKNIELTKIKLETNSWPKELAAPIAYAAIKWGIEEDLIIALIFTESSFIKYAKSNKNYHGYMQIPDKIYETYSNIDIGVGILNQKMKRADGDLYKALHYYKGYCVGSQRGKRIVSKTINISMKLKNYQESIL